MKTDDLDLIHQYVNNILSKTAGNIRDKLYQMGDFAITKFYATYQPKHYERQWDMWNTIEKYYANNHRSIYYGGITISADNLNQGLHADNIHEVNDLVWHGFHGHPSLPVMRPSPLELVDDYRDYIADHMQEFIDEVQG